MEYDKRGIDICVLPRVHIAKVYSHTLYVCNFSFVHFVALLSPPSSRASISPSPASARIVSSKCNGRRISYARRLAPNYVKCIDSCRRVRFFRDLFCDFSKDDRVLAIGTLPVAFLRLAQT